MRLLNNKNYAGDIIDLKNKDWLFKQRIAGRIAGEALSILENLVKNKSCSNLLEFDKIAENHILTNGCTPTFKNYKNFPNTCCVSVNQTLVHGIPSNYNLKDGDIVTFDLGATFEGAIGDTALTCIYGNPKKQEHVRMIEVAKLCLTNAINSIKVGNKLGCIGNAIYKTAKKSGFKVIENYGGHGISWNLPHTAPFISNKANEFEGIVIQPGLAIAIEPLLVPITSSTQTKIGLDNWSVSTEDVSCHEEHSVFVHEDHVEIITERR